MKRRTKELIAAGMLGLAIGTVAVIGTSYRQSISNVHPTVMKTTAESVRLTGTWSTTMGGGEVLSITTFDDDGTYESINNVDEVRTGQWTLTNKTVKLADDDGSTVFMTIVYYDANNMSVNVKGYDIDMQRLLDT